MTSEYWSQIGQGTLMTLWLTFASALLSLVIGTVIAVMRNAPIAPVRSLAASYTEFFRNIPLLTVLFFIYFGVPNTGLRLSAVVGAIWGLGLYTAAYVAEVIRAGLGTVSKGNVEAARSLGLDFFQTLRYVQLPQALRAAIPPLGHAADRLAEEHLARQHDHRGRATLSSRLRGESHVQPQYPVDRRSGLYRPDPPARRIGQSGRAALGNQALEHKDKQTIGSRALGFWIRITPDALRFTFYGSRFSIAFFRSCVWQLWRQSALDQRWRGWLVCSCRSSALLLLLVLIAARFRHALGELPAASPALVAAVSLDRRAGDHRRLAGGDHGQPAAGHRPGARAAGAASPGSAGRASRLSRSFDRCRCCC